MTRVGPGSVPQEAPAAQPRPEPSASPRSFAPPFPPRAGGEARAGLVAPDALHDIIDGLPEQIALLDESWTILAVNKAWEESAATARIPGLQLGANYLHGCEAFAATGHPDGKIMLQALQQISSGQRKYFEHVYSKTDPPNAGDFKVNISRFESGGDWFVMITRYEVTELMALGRQYRRLEQSLIRVQEEERRRIGRDIHDATAQLLVALHLNVLRLKGMHRDEETRAVIKEIDDTLDRVNHEIRAISFLLHPPSLEEGGLVEALDAMARGFARRTGLKIGFWFDGDPQRWDAALESTLYRLAQEALANVHRHAHASRVGIRLVARPGRFLHLIVEDDGVGMPAGSRAGQAPLGVGIAGMRSRIRELNGRFSIQRRSTGTCVIASVPLGRNDFRPFRLIG